MTTKTKFFCISGWILFAGLCSSLIALFYFGFYKYLLIPKTKSYRQENTRHLLANHREATTLVLGDSTATYDFRTNYYNRLAPAREKAFNAGIPGTGLLSQAKMATYAQAHLPQLKKILFIVGPDLFLDQGEERIFSDIEYNKTSLTLQDAALLWRYTSTSQGFGKAMVSLLLRPVLFGQDLQNLFLHPWTRLAALKSSQAWLTRPIAATDPLWEDDQSFSVCTIENLDHLQEAIAAADRLQHQDEVQWLQTMARGYEARPASKPVNPSFPRQLQVFLADLARVAENIYVVNAPIFSGFTKPYTAADIHKMETLTAAVAQKIPKVTYIAPPRTLPDDCQNFMDFVHLNPYGAQLFTEYLWQEIQKSE